MPLNIRAYSLSLVFQSDSNALSANDDMNAQCPHSTWV
jgi:hypothetical protein